MERLTVLTVTYNAEKELPATLASVQAQGYPHIRHVVVDGASKDGTQDIIHAHKDQLHYSISEPDKGLYDAMNKALAIAEETDWVIFLNAGDVFYDEDTVAKVMEQAAQADVLFGKTLMVQPDGTPIGDRTHKKLPEQLSWKSFKWGMVVSHQALLVRKRVAATYDLRYACAADIDWSIRTLKSADKVIYTHQYIDRFQEGGISDSRRKQCLKERFHIIRRHFGLGTTLVIHMLIVLKFVGRGFRLR